MKNSDMPAMPYVIPGNVATKTYGGLNKREIFAMHAMQSLVTARLHWDMKFNEVASLAVEHADALLQELEK
jgi:hypothetical protein